MKGALESNPPRAEIVSSSDNEVVIKGHVCAMGLKGAGKEICEAIMAVDQETITEMVGKPLDMRIVKSLATGDDHCIIKFTLKEK